MSFIKLKADQLFDGYQFLEQKVLILEKDGTIVEKVNDDGTLEDVRRIDGILCPGFINCHCHLELSHLKNLIPEKTGLIKFVNQVVQKRNFSEDVILQAINDAEEEMIKNGIVAVGDICNSTHTLLQKQKGNIYYHNFIEAIGFNPANADVNFETYKNIYHQFLTSFPFQQVSITPHAPYSISEPLWEKILQFEGANLLSIHNQETEDENLLFENKSGGFIEMFHQMGLDLNNYIASGKSSLQTYLPKLLPQQQVLLIHNVYSDKTDIAFTKHLSNSFYWCICANANNYISGILPNMNNFIDALCNLVIGTDSLASNHQLSIWDEINTIREAYKEIPLASLLHWATVSGAKALNIDSQYGSFEKGKKPGLVCIQNSGAKRLII